MAHCRKRRRTSRFDGRQEQFAVLLCLLLLLLLFVLLLQASPIHASSTFPGRLPPVRYEQASNSSRKGFESADGASSDDGGDLDEIESSSEDESLWGYHPVPTRNPQLDSPLLAAAPTKAERSSPHRTAPTATLGDGTLSSSSRHQGSSPLPIADAGAPMRDSAAGVEPPTPSQSLQTLQKLQNMLDETDYLTTSRRKQQSAKDHDSIPPSIGRSSSPGSDSKSDAAIVPALLDSGRLWTSKDRAKYKKQQHKIRQKQQEELLVLPKKRKDEITPDSRAPFHVPQQSSPPIHPFSDDEQEQQSDDFDDGLGVSLPNVPVYYSDAEGDSDPGTDVPPSTAPLPSTFQSPGPPRQREPTAGSTVAPRNHTESVLYHMTPQPPIGLNYYEPQRFPPSSARQSFGPLPQGETVPPQQYYPPYPPYHPNGLPYMYQAGHYGPYLHPPAYHGQFGSWGPSLPPPPGFAQGRAAHPAGVAMPHGVATPRQYAARGVIQPPPPPPPPTQPRPTNSVEAGTQVRDVTSFEATMAAAASPTDSSSSREISLSSPSHQHPHHETAASFADPRMNYYGMAPAYFIAPENPQSLAEASSYLNLASIEKVSLLLVTVALACYAGVSPRTLPLTEYNLMFYENLRLVSLALIAPAMQILSVCDARENDMNALVNTFFVSFTFGYLLTFAAEVVATTMVRLAVFYFLEPRIFAVTPTVPSLVLPWVLRDIKYRPKRITLFAADFGTSCVACPIIEEYIKLMVLRWTVSLPRNFNWVTRSSPKSKQRKRVVAEPVLRNLGEKDVTTANKYVTQMLAVSLGIKLCDAGRRILLYTKAHHANKSFFAIFRGIFPIHELCGTMTALALAKRDLLGFYTPLWKILAPAVVIHGMANYRGMKPIFKWNSATPWSEMQLYPLNFADSSTFPQLLSKGFGKFMWFVVLGRVLGYCVKNYYMVNRQAVKRTTTYAGKHSAFSAELETAEALKKQK